MTELEEAQSRLNVAESVAPAAFLGRICWYSVPEATMVGHMEFCRDLLTRDLDKFHLPLAPKPVDVFRRASKSVQGKHRIGDKFTANYLVRDLSMSPEEVERVLVREVVDSDNHVLWFESVAVITFSRANNFVKTKHTPPEQVDVEGWTNKIDHQCRKLEDEKLNEVRSTYALNTHYITSYVVRETIRKILSRLDATVMRDGVYFVGESRVGELEGLEALVNALDGCSFHSLPLVDDARQREMLKAAFLDDCLGQIDDLIGKIRKILQSEDTRITPNRFADLQVLRTELRDRAETYKSMLETSLGETEVRLDALDQQLWELVRKVKKEE